MKLQKEKIPFTLVANEVLKSSNLSWKAKGLYAYLFSKPDDWDFSSTRMVVESKDGRESIMTGLQELEKHGFLERKRLPNGKMEYTLKYSDKSLSREIPLGVEEPKSGNPTVGKTLCGESRPISNIEYTTNTEEKVIYTFDAFWNIYPKKVERKKSELKWSRLSKKIQDLIIKDVPLRKGGRKWQAGFVENPLTYLNGERWNDEIEGIKNMEHIKI